MRYRSIIVVSVQLQIFPIFSYIEPKRFVYVEIVAHIENFDESCLDRQIEANLLGIVRVAPQFRYRYLSQIY